MATELVNQGICTAIICSDIDPKSHNAFDRLDEELKAIDNGTSHPWKALRDDSTKPVKCTKGENKWHYMAIC